MSQKKDKRIRRMMRKNKKEFVKEFLNGLDQWSFKDRFWLAWKVIRKAKWDVKPKKEDNKNAQGNFVRGGNPGINNNSLSKNAQAAKE